MIEDVNTISGGKVTDNGIFEGIIFEDVTFTLDCEGAEFIDCEFFDSDCTWLDVLARAGKVKIHNGHFTGCTRPAISCNGVESVPGIIVPRGELGTDDED